MGRGQPTRSNQGKATIVNVETNPVCGVQMGPPSSCPFDFHSTQDKGCAIVQGHQNGGLPVGVPLDITLPSKNYTPKKHTKDIRTPKLPHSACVWCLLGCVLQETAAQAKLGIAQDLETSRWLGSSNRRCLGRGTKHGWLFWGGDPENCFGVIFDFLFDFPLNQRSPPKKG